jgi:hypothetical protein
VIDDDRIMMCLAGLSYRGFWRMGWGDVHVRAITSGISLGLESLGLTSWQIVWGPACFRPPLGWFDDQVVVVMHDGHSNPERYAVVIRGTNPISLSDWLFGDLLADPPVPWPFDRTAHLTPSTALGLAVLLAQGAKPDSALARVRLLLDGVDFAKAEARASDLRARIRSVKMHHAGFAPAVTLLSRLKRRGSSGAWIAQALQNEIRTGTRMVGAHKDLIGYLREAVRSSSRNVEVIVAGHSKGGALAAALAGWLGQTRADGPEEARWDPDRRARLRCFTFAGPTAGDGSFNNLLLNSLNAGDFRRIWNRFDIVPHAFGWSDLEEIRTLYDAELIAPLLEALRELVRNDGYSQVGHGLPFPDDPKPASAKLSLLKAVDNHMENYLRYLNISHSTPWFFLGEEPGALVRWILGMAGHR